MRYLKDLKDDFAGKIFLVRVDFNVENLKNSLRLKASLPTLKFLLKKNARIVLLSHRGRPTPGSRSSLSLRPIGNFLKNELKAKIIFEPEFNFKKIKNSVRQSAPKSVFLMENLRFLEGEEKNSLTLGKEIASLGDIYINDAFAVSHRKNASITQLPKFLPSYAGLLLEKEINAMEKILKSFQKPLIVILGGAKVSDKIGVIKNLRSKAQYFLIGGMIANTFLKAHGSYIGRSYFEPKMLGVAKKLLKSKKIILPWDFISEKNAYFDIGPISAKYFAEKIKLAKTILWNGPLGLFENKRFIRGSEAIAKAVASQKAFSLIGGGETTELINKLKLEKKISFLSTGGGAMLEYLSGKKLPGIEALNNR